MLKSGMGEKTILLAVQQAPTKFDTSPEALIQLKNAGASDALLNAMLLASTTDTQVTSLPDKQHNCKLLKTVLDAMGGPKLNAVRALRLKGTGTMQIPAGHNISVQLEEVYVLPDKTYLRVDLPTGSLIEVITPNNSYIASGNQRGAVPKVDLDRVRFTSSPFYMAQHFQNYSCELQGTEQIGGVSTFKLRINAEGTEFYWNVDPSTNRILRDRIHNADGEVITDASDWRIVDGIYFPFRSHHVVNNKIFERYISDYWVNPAIDSKLFEPPSSIAQAPTLGKSTVASAVSSNQNDMNGAGGPLSGTALANANGVATDSSVPTNTAFSFKGNKLGMTLEQFRSNPANVASIWINTGDPKKRLDKKKSQQVNTPLCSNQYAQIEDFPVVASGEIICITGTPPHDVVERNFQITKQGGINTQSLTVAGHDPEHVWYRFYREHLYAIEIGKFSPFEFADLLQAFEQKLGQPNRTSNEEYQNGFGAHWSGEVVIWQKGTQIVSLKEGPGMGPGQNHFSRTDGPEIIFADLSIAEQLKTGVKPDF
jgi:hypothetical protein